MTLKQQLYEININDLIEYKLTANQYILLNIINNGSEVDYINYITMETYREEIVKDDLYTLYKKDYISNNSITNYTFKFSELALTNKGVNLLQNKEAGIKESPFEEFIMEYYNKFPDKVYTGNLLVKGCLPKCKTKMITFIKTYKYPYEVILKATDNYIKVCKTNSWQYMRTAYYFIEKLGESVLADYCAQVTDTKEESKEQGLFKEI
jgi:hypothetical protein